MIVRIARLLAGRSGVGTDSVDGDDGAIDGQGQDGAEFRTVQQPSQGTTICFDFDEAVLVTLPTHATVAWT